jgi:hypothetical protein
MRVSQERAIMREDYEAGKWSDCSVLLIAYYPRNK